MVRRISFLAVLAGALLLFSFAQAQVAPRDNAASGQDRGGRRGNFDPAQMRERELNRVKEELGATDDEWKVLTPKVEKVMTLQRDTRGGFRGFGGRPGGERPSGDRPAGDRPGGSDQPQSKVALAQRELSTTLQNKSATTEEITKKLTALREARQKARDDLQKAQKELKELVTARQEAVLVVNGMLD